MAFLRGIAWRICVNSSFLIVATILTLLPRVPLDHLCVLLAFSNRKSSIVGHVKILLKAISIFPKVPEHLPASTYITKDIFSAGGIYLAFRVSPISMSLERKVGEEASKDNEPRKGKRSIKYGRLIFGVGATAYSLVSTFAGVYLGAGLLAELPQEPSFFDAAKMAVCAGIAYMGLRTFSGGLDIIRDAVNGRKKLPD